MLHIRKKLDLLSTLHAQRDLLRSEKQRLIEQEFPPDFRTRLSEIEQEFAQKEEAAERAMEALKAEIRADTLVHGRTVKGVGFEAVWCKGRVTWDDGALGTYAEFHSEILAYRKEGKPVISIRRLGYRDGGAGPRAVAGAAVGVRRPS